MRPKQPAKLAFDTTLLTYAVVKKHLSTLLSAYECSTESLAVQLQESTDTLTIKIRSSDRYAILKLKTEVLALQEDLTKELDKQHLLHGKGLSIKISLA
jgi:hypothetical protein